MTTSMNRGKRVVGTQASSHKGRRRLVRGEVVVRRVLEAALHELGRVGYHGFRIESVAAHARVNKTTIYRRWPTKKALVRDALGASMRTEAVPVHTGSPRSDLLAAARSFAKRIASPLGRGIVRMLAAEGAEPELLDIVRSLRQRNHLLVEGDGAPGESSAMSRHLVLAHSIAGAIVQKAVFMNERVTERYLQSLIDLVLFGCAKYQLPPGASVEGRIR